MMTASDAPGSDPPTYCIGCSPGTYMSRAGSTDTICSECPQGFISAVNSADCEACPRGYIADKQASAKCTVCARGTYSDRVGQANCTNCPAGWRRKGDQLPATACSACESGTTSTDPGATVCDLCDLGRWSPPDRVERVARGEPGCEACPSGWYQDVRGQLVCTACPQDTFLATTGATSGGDCKSCAVDYSPHTTTNGSVGVVDPSVGCVCAGADMDAQAGSDISRGYYEVSSSSSSSSSSSIANSTQRTCVVCEVGAVCADANLTLDRLEAETGRWRESDTSTKFYPCLDPDEEFEECPGGVVGQQCAESFAGPLCATCAPGHVRISSSECLACPDGQGMGHAGFAGIAVAGAASCAVLLLVLVVYFARKERATEGDFKTDIKSSVKAWKVVPGHTTNAKPEPRDKEETKPQDEEKAESLSAQAADLGSEVARAQSQALVDDTMDEQKGVMTGDGSADTGSYGADTADTDDAEAKAEALQAALEVHELTSALAQLQLAKRGLAGKLRILIGFLQINTALVTAFSVPWPPTFLALLKHLGVVNLDLFGIFGTLDPCSLHTPFLAAASFHMAVLPLLSLIVALAAVLARLLLRQRAAVVKKRAKQSLLAIVFLLFPGIVTKVFTALNCRKIGSAYYLVADYSVVCFEGEHATTTLLMVVCIFVYVLGIPLGSFFFLWYNKKKGMLFGKMKHQLEFAEVFGSMYDAFEPRYWYFETVVLFQKLLLTGGLVLVAPGSSVQILIGLIVALVFFSFLLKTQPYEDAYEDAMQTTATMSTVATLLIGFTLKLTDSLQAANARAVGGAADGDGEAGLYDGIVMDAILVLLFALVCASGVFMTAVSCPGFDVLVGKCCK